MPIWACKRFQLAGWLAEALDLPVQDGLLVEQATKGGPAAAAGIHGGDRVAQAGMRRIMIGGDVIVALDGQKVGTKFDMNVCSIASDPATPSALLSIAARRK